MNECCAIRPVHGQQRRVLLIVLWINLAMFLAELVAGLIAHSTALLADSVDMLGDAIVYGFSLYVIARAPVFKLARHCSRASSWPSSGSGLSRRSLRSSFAA